jgi:hypothetical protein
MPEDALLVIQAIQKPTANASNVSIFFVKPVGLNLFVYNVAQGIIFQRY